MMSTELATQPPLPQPIVAIEALTPDAPLDAILETLTKLDFIAEKVRQWREVWKDKAFDWVKKNGEFKLGDRRWYIAVPRETKCIDVAKAIPALFDAAGGDIGTLATCLSSNAVLPGASKKLLTAEAYALHFKTEVKERLASESTVKKPKSDAVKVPCGPELIETNDLFSR